MARYCFYCGRELSNNEKCDCRTRGAASASSYKAAQESGESSASVTDKAGKAGKANRGNALRRFFQAFNPFSSAEQPKTTRKKPVSHRQTARPTAAGKPHINFKASLQSIGSGLKRLGTYLILPADGIRSAIQAPSHSLTLLILLLQSALGGVFLIILSRQTVLRSLLNLSMTSASLSGQFSSGLFIFLQGFGISLIAVLLLTLLYQLAMRYLFRTSVSYRRLLSGFSPSFLFYALFMLASTLALPASLFSALLLLFTGFAASALSQYLALRHLTDFDDNRCFILITFVLLLYTSILAMFLNLSLPVLKALLNSSDI
ncbi:MAG TPA: hypothetical protein DD640_00715, partial [Clostridiales bacterium]|nr:hypothetical protein [Clostridiales bacterium]